MGRFYKNVQNMPQNDVDLLMQTYINKQIKLYYYNKDLISNAVKTSFEAGDYIYAKTEDEKVFMNGKYFIFNSGTFGECSKSTPIRYMIPIESTSCGFKIVFLFNFRKVSMFVINILGMMFFN
jgi:hypothetical protein